MRDGSLLLRLRRQRILRRRNGVLLSLRSRDLRARLDRGRDGLEAITGGERGGDPGEFGGDPGMGESPISSSVVAASGIGGRSVSSCAG